MDQYSNVAQLVFRDTREAINLDLQHFIPGAALSWPYRVSIDNTQLQFELSNFLKQYIL